MAPKQESRREKSRPQRDGLVTEEKYLLVFAATGCEAETEHNQTQECKRARLWNKREHLLAISLEDDGSIQGICSKITSVDERCLNFPTLRNFPPTYKSQTHSN